MDIIFLGTSCMQPTKERNHPGVLLLYKGEGLLFDCGEGIQRQLRLAGIKPTVIKKIFISHWHGDHVLGIPGLLQTLSASGGEGPIEIYGPKGTKRFVGLIGKAFVSKDVIECRVKEVRRGIVIDEEEYVIETDEMDHSAPCVGYAFREKDKRRMNMNEVKKRGLPVGPLLGKLQQGEEVVYKDKKVTPDDVTTLVKGRKVSYITDTRPCDGALRLARDADLLIIESTYKSDLEDKAKEYFHLTAQEAALIAGQAHAKQMVLTHFSIRYKNVQELEEDARNIFDNTRTAEDLLRIRL